jgi:hypothetical protein
MLFKKITQTIKTFYFKKDAIGELTETWREEKIQILKYQNFF